MTTPHQPLNDHRDGESVNGMGLPATFVNGHRGQDGAIAAAPVLAPIATPPALDVQRAGPVSDWPPPQQHDPGDAGRTEKWRHVLSAHRGWLAAIPVILVNAVAFAGQLAFLRDHLPWPLAGQVLVAVTLESVAVYLAWQAHLALAADDSALRLRLAAYGFAAVIGVMNYSHWMAPGWRPTFAAVTFGLMSVSSPWLWSVHSRRVSRDAPHAVRLGATRWVWHPWRSATVMWHATWAGENDPAKAIALVAPATEAGAQPGVDSDTDESAGEESPAADSESSSDTNEPPDDEHQRQRAPSGSDRVRDVVKRHRALRKRLLDGDAATRKAAKAEAAEKAGVSVRTVERVVGDLAKTAETGKGADVRAPGL
jgi:hypothetical protein